MVDNTVADYIREAVGAAGINLKNTGLVARRVQSTGKLPFVPEETFTREINMFPELRQTFVQTPALRLLLLAGFF